MEGELEMLAPPWATRAGRCIAQACKCLLRGGYGDVMGVVPGTGTKLAVMKAHKGKPGVLESCPAESLMTFCTSWVSEGTSQYIFVA